MMFRYAVVCALLGGTDAFVPSGKLATIGRRHRSITKNVIPKDNQEVVPVSITDHVLPELFPEESTEVFDLFDDETIALTIETLVVTEPKTVAHDQGKEIFLESIEGMSPEQVFADIEVQGSKHAQSTSSDDVVSKMDTSRFSAVDDRKKTEMPLLVKALSNSTMDDLKAVLDISGEAAAAAEASLPPALKKQLEFRSNSTSMSLTAEEVPKIICASSVVGEPVTSTSRIQAPSVAKILKFAVPAIGVWLCGPLLSLIDTSAVGLFSGTIQQAALNPAVAVTDYAALLIAFMYTGTTNLVAAAQEADHGTPDKPVTTKTLIGAMRLSTFVGAGLGAVLFVFARPMLKAIIGNDGISPAVFDAAMKYVRIRALGMPAAAIIGSTQAACLGMQDIRSPLYVLVAAAVVNFFGDVLFVGNTHPLVGGAAGAAWATILSQYAGVALFVRWLAHKPKKNIKPVNVSKAILEMTGTPDSAGTKRRAKLQNTLQSFSLTEDETKGPGKLVGSLFKKMKPKKKAASKPKEVSFSVRGFLQNKLRFVDLVKPPSSETRKQFAPYLLPVTTTQVGRVSGYVAMSHVVASSLGTVSMAAQQVIVSLFYCLCPIADSLSLTAQSFVPSIFQKKASEERAKALRTTALNFGKAGAVMGAILTAIVSMIPLFTGFFTSDPAVIGLVNSVVPLLLAFFSVHGVLCASEGLLLGQTDLGFLGKMYGLYFFVLPTVLLQIKKAALSGRNIDLTSVWKVFVGYQAFRLVAWVSRVSMLQRKAEAEVAQQVVAYPQAAVYAP